MSSSLLLFFVLITQSSTDEAIRGALLEKAQGNLLQAEGLLLDHEPPDAQVGRVGYRLAELALQIGNIDEKIVFYETRLFAGRTARSVALYVLACLHAHTGQYDRFADRAVAFLTEYSADRSRYRYRLLYHLARFTSVSPDDLNLNEAEATWFDACRNLAEDAVFPQGASASWPFPWAFLSHLESSQPFTAPTPPADDLDAEAAFFLKLLEFKEALNREEFNQAAELANAIIHIDRNKVLFDQRVWFYRLLEELHTARSDTARATQTQQRRLALIPLCVLPFRAQPEAQRQRVAAEASMQEAVTEKPREVPAPKEIVAQVKPGTITVGEGTVRSQLQEIEMGLQQGQPIDADELAKSLKIASPYDRIYADYLRGLSYLKDGRFKSSFDALTTAEDKIRKLPFPILESKIQLALGQAFDMEHNAQQAEWYRLAAAQIWAESEILPLLDEEPAAVNPYLVLIDQHLSQATEKDVVSGLLYHNEMLHFTRIRQKAFQRSCLSTNPIINNQIGEMGRQLAITVAQIAERDVDLSSRYNDTVEVWQQLWTRVLPYYKTCQTPSVEDIQRVLSRTDRAVALVEGAYHVGAVIISKTNAFAIGLGNKRDFLRLDEAARVDFLEQRMGPIFQQMGKLWLFASPLFRNAAFMEHIMSRTGNRDGVKWLFSFRSLFPAGQVESCLGTLVFSEDRAGAVYDFVQTLPRAGLNWFAEQAVTKNQMLKNMSNHAHFVFQGEVTLTDDGLFLGMEERGFFAHELLFENPELCSLTLISPKFAEWGAAFDEIELINVQSPMDIRLGHSLQGLGTEISAPKQTSLVFH